MKEVLKKLGLFESLDLELKMSPDDASESLKKISEAEQVTIFNLSILGQVDYKGTYGEVNQRNRLPIHFDIYPRYYIMLTTLLSISALIFSFFGIGLAILALSSEEYKIAFGIFSFCLLLIFLFTILPLKIMQWRIWDLRLDIEREFKKKEKQLDIDIVT